MIYNFIHRIGGVFATMRYTNLRLLYFTFNDLERLTASIFFYLDHLIITTADEVEPVGGHVQCVDAARQRPVQLAHPRRVQRLPVADLPVGARRQQLVLLRMIADTLEQRVDADHLPSASSPVTSRLIRNKQEVKVI